MKTSSGGILVALTYPGGETNPPTRRTNLPGLGRPEEERRSPEVLEAALEPNRRGRARVGDEPGERASLTGRTIHSVLDKRGVHAVPAAAATAPGPTKHDTPPTPVQ